MAIRVPIISDFDEAGINKALMGFKKLSHDLSVADGAMAKFRVASGAAFDLAKQNAIAFGAAAAGAVTAFVGKAIGDFMRLGLAVDKFSSATGTTTEQASRFIEVMGDMGIESNSLQTALNKLNRAAADGADGFKMIGAEIARTSSGAVDVQQTFFNVIDALRGIQDPALRAKAATELLGRGWMELSRLVGEGSAKLKTALASVSDTKIFSNEDTQRAKDFQAAMEKLKDVAEDFAINVARQLLPVLQKAVELLAQLGEIMGTATFTADDLNKYLGRTVMVTEQMAAAWRDGYAAMASAQDPMNVLTAELDAMETELEQVKTAWDTFKGALNLEVEFARVSENIDAFETKWIEAMVNGTVNAAEFRKELNLQKLEVAALAEQVGLAKNAVENTVMRIAVDTRPLKEALTLINMIKNAQLGITGKYVTTPYGSMPLQNYSPLAGFGGQYGIPKMASGGIVSGPTLAMIGEAGPEAVIPLDRLGSMGGVTVNVAGSVVSENDLIESIRKGLANAQRNGSQLVYSNI